MTDSRGPNGYPKSSSAPESAGKLAKTTDVHIPPPQDSDATDLEWGPRICIYTQYLRVSLCSLSPNYHLVNTGLDGPRIPRLLFWSSRLNLRHRHNHLHTKES